MLTLSLVTIFVVSLINHITAFSTPSTTAYNIIASSTSLLDPSTGTKASSPILSSNNNDNKKKQLVVILPQLGEFDSSEYCEFLIAAQDLLDEKNINLSIIGIGDTTAASTFCKFTGLSPDKLYIDPNGDIHKALSLHSGPNFNIPDGISDDVLKFFLRQLPGGIPEEEEMLRPVATAWLNYNAMCAGIGAPGTLKEILRNFLIKPLGYLGRLENETQWGSM